MSLATAPIVCTPFVAIGSPIVSIGDASAWTWPDESPAAAATPAPADAAAAVAARVRPEASPSVVAWRQNYYAFRHARTRIEAGRAADAVPFIVGECAAYVQSRIAELAKTDARFADALALATGAAVNPAAVLDVPQVDVHAGETSAPTNQAEAVASPAAAASVDVDRAELLRRVKLAAIFADLKSPKAVLRCIRLTIAGGRLTLSATDVRSVACVVVPGAAVAGELVADVEAAQLVDALAGKARRVRLTLEDAGATLAVAADGSRAAVPTVPSDLPHRVALEPAGAPWLALPMGAAIRATDRAMVAMGKEGTRYAFNGTLLSVERGRLDVVATDGRRLVRVPLARVGGPKESIIIDRADVVRLRKLAAKRTPDDVLDVRIGGWVEEGSDARWIELRGPGFVFACQSLAGQFPPYVEVIPKESPRSCVFDVAALSDAVERGAAACQDATRGARFTFDAGASALTVASKCDGRDAQASAPVLERRGEWADVAPIGFNPDQITQFLAAAGAGRVTFAWSAPNRPGLFELADGTQYVVMPVTLA